MPATSGAAEDADLHDLATKIGEAAGLAGGGVGIIVRKSDSADKTPRERRLQALIEASSDWLWEVDAELCVSYLSANFEALTGGTLASLIGRRLDESPHIFFESDADATYRGAITARTAFRDIAFTITTSDGTRRLFKISGLPIFDEDGWFCGYHGIGTDDTAEAEAAARLRDSEERFRQLFEAASDWFWEEDATGRLTFVSPRHTEVTGNTTSKNLGLRREEYGDTSLHPDAWRSYLADVAARRPFRDFIYRHARPDRNGRLRWTKTSGVPVFDADGAFRGYRGAASDVTAQVEAEATARKALLRFHDAIENIGNPVSIFGADKRFITGNQAYRDLHRRPDGSSIIREGLHIRELMEWRLRSAFWRTPPVDSGNVVDSLLATLERSTATFDYELADGRSMLVEHRLMKDGSNVSTWTDVTSMRAAEAHRRELEAQLHHAQKLDALGQLAGGIAHDLNNALVPVLALAKMVQEDLPPESGERGMLDLVVQGGQRAKALVQQILSFSRKEMPVRRAVDFAALVGEAMTMLQASVSATIELVARIAPVGDVYADAGQLHQVIVNLVTNAAQAIGAQGGTVTVTVEPAAPAEDGGGQVMLTVADTGAGMDETVRARLFEPFFTTKPVGEGTGLGLAVVHGIVTSHGGTIAVDSKPGQGARFAILLPLAPPAEASAAL
jgi:two-component system cell cycle sensor histidine kinase/response regulator CckA